MSNQEDQPQQNSANVSVSNGDIMPSTPPPVEKKTNHNRNGNSLNYKNKNNHSNNSKNNASNSEANQQHAHHQSQQNSHQQEVQNFPDISGEIASFSEKTFDELEAFSKAVGVKTHGKMNYQDLVLSIVKEQMEKKGFEFIIGVLEVMESGFGFLRQSQWNYAKSPGDVYVSPASIKQYNLKKGDTIAGFIKEPKNGDKADKFKALSKIVSVNYKYEFGQKKRVTFDSLVPIYPNERFNLETTSSAMLSTRILNMFSPIGKGQRSLIVAPPRTGKTILLQNIANAIVSNHPEIYLIVLLIDERPEEVTDMQRSVRGEVISSTFDEEPDKHCHVAEIVLEKAKRLTEEGLDIVILLDSITRLARAYNQNIPASGKVLSGGVDAKALIGPKKFFGAARNIEHGGSLTIIGTSLIETGSRMDEVIFEEFKGTGNMEVNLDRSMSERRIYPAIDIFKSGTRKEELLLPASELEISWAIREQLSSRKAESGEIMRLMIEKLKEFKTNKAFLSSYKFSGTKNI